MSLTSHIKPGTKSPLRTWFEANLPETRRLATDANRVLRHGADECPIPPVEGADPGLVGTAVDYLLRACLRVRSIEWTAASRAAQRLAENPSIGMRAIEVEREAVTAIKTLHPSSRDLSDSEWSRLCASCLALARFEQHYRAGPMNLAVHEVVTEPLKRCTGLDDFLSLSVSQASIQDLEELGRRAWEDSRSLRSARPLVLNPAFELSADLGGADADLIARRRLIDWKSTCQTRIVGRTELWQLAGYALADTSDSFGIREVAIAALRWRSAIHWEIDDFLDALAPGPPATLHILGRGTTERKRVRIEELRRDFAQVILKRARPAGLRSQPIGRYPDSPLDPRA